MDFLYLKNLFFVSTTLRFNVLSYKFNKVCILALILSCNSQNVLLFSSSIELNENSSRFYVHVRFIIS